MSLKEGLLFYRLPSTSPAKATRFKDKLDQWKVILPYLGLIDNSQ